jgi:uncharacterized protein YpiB (UPF0302 family)
MEEPEHGLALAEQEAALNGLCTTYCRLRFRFRRISLGRDYQRRRHYESRHMLHDKDVDASAVRGLVDAALVIARKRQELLKDLRASLEINDTEGALKLARKLCGLEHEEIRD